MKAFAKNKLTDESTKIMSLEASAFKVLHKNEDRINEKLKNISTLNQADDFQKKYLGVIREILRIVGKAIFELTKDENPSAKDIDFYFWPGYDSYLDREIKRRVLITPENDDKEECGIGFDGNGNCYDFAPTKIGFDHFLDTNKSFLVKGKYYTPGSTHDWLSQERNPVLKPDKGENIPLKILEVQLAKDYATRVNPDTGKVTLKLKEDDSEKWGKTIASILNGDVYFTSNLMNYVVNCEKRWPLVMEETWDKDVIVIREKLYSAWLVSCFLPNWKELGWLNDFKEVESALSKLNARQYDLIEKKTNRPESVYSASYYNHWYSILLSRNASLSEDIIGIHRNELGSIMLLTTYPINGALLYLIKYWIESIYLKLRSIEDQYYIKKKERSETTSKWAHALKTRIEFLKPLVKEVKKAKDEAGTLKNYIEILDLKIHELANLASAVHEITKENYNFAAIQKELKNYNYSENSSGHNHINLLLQESIKTALCRVVTDSIYIDYRSAREKIIAEEYLTREESAQTVHAGGKNLPNVFLEKSDLQLFLFGDADTRGMINYNAVDIHEFLSFLYRKTKFEGILSVEFKEFSDEEKEIFNMYLTLPEIQTVDIRFPFSAIVSLVVDEILLNAFKYFDKNDRGENYIKIIIHRPQEPLTDENIGKLMNMTITIRNTTNKNTSSMKKSQKTSTGLNFIETCLRLFCESGADITDKEEDGYVEYNLNLPIVSSRDEINFRRE